MMAAAVLSVSYCNSFIRTRWFVRIFYYLPSTFLLTDKEYYVIILITITIMLIVEGHIMKFSKQREMILNQVLNYPIHPTADQVYTALKTDNPNLSLGTVYRNLNLLSEMGMLMKIRIADGSDRFDGRTDDHYHMVCERCSKVYDMELDTMKALKSCVSDKYGHALTEITLTLKGVCAACTSCTPQTE